MARHEKVEVGLVSRLRGLCFFILLMIAAMTAFVLLLPCILFTPWAPSWRRSRQTWRRFANECFCQFASSLLYCLGNIEVVVHRADMEEEEDSEVFIICNHRSTVDWMFCGWTYASFFEHYYPFLIFLLKESLRAVPLFGYAAQTLPYAFLGRRREQDVPHLRRLLRYFAGEHKTLPAIIMFPEGTDLSESNVFKNGQYASKKGLNQLKYVLYPRPKGFVTCLSSLKSMPSRNVVLHNLTIAYEDFNPGQRTTHYSILRGEFPHRVHLFLQRVPLKVLPDDEPGLEKWLLQSFEDKEKLLTAFYETGNDPSISLRSTFPSQTTSGTMATFRRILYTSIMTVMSLGVVTLLFTSSWIRLFFVLYCFAFAAISQIGGYELAELYFSGY